MSCCQKQGQVYLIFTNFLFFIFGCALLSFGMMATQLKIGVAILIPSCILQMISILGIILIFTSLIGLLGSFYRERRSVYVICTIAIVAAFIYQLSIAVIVYSRTAHITSWISQTWAEASSEYRLYAQTKFHCCGYTGPMDHPTISEMCIPHETENPLPPCYGPMNRHVKQELTRIYIVLFVSLVIELLALCNSITQLCTMNPARSWEVSPENIIEQRKFTNMNEHNDSANTLVEATYSKYKRQF